VDTIWVVMVSLVLLMVVGGMAVAFADGTPQGQIGGWIALGTLVLVVLVVGLLAWPVEYTLCPEDLEIRTGWVRWKIAYTSISGIRAEKTWMSGPTLSHDRWRIDYEEGGMSRFVWVSPKDKEAFRKELEALLPPGRG